MTSPPISTADRDKLTELAARAEAGSGEDRRLEAEIGQALGFATVVGIHPLIPPLTSSLDAVVALIAERLPKGAEWSVQVNSDGCVATLVCGQWADDYVHCGSSPTKRKATREEILEDDALKRVRQHHILTSAIPKSPARALLTALLRAIAAQQDRQTKG